MVVKNSNLKSVYFYVMLSFLLSQLNGLSQTYAQYSDLIHPVFMFENTVRRDGTFEEAQSIVYMNSGCTGFFIKNKNNKPYIMTARHCYNYNFENECQRGLIYLYTVGKDRKARVGKCQKVIASSKLDDAVIFEAEFEADFKFPNTAYSLVGKEVPSCSKVELIGFPSDPQRQGRLTVSENCWTQPGNTHHADQMFNDPSKEQESAEDLREFWAQNPELLNQLTSLSIHPGYYNCSVYGGNSGGPLKLKDQQIAIGLPFQYLHVEGVVFPRSSYTVYESLAGFVNRHYTVLESKGISIAEEFQVETVFECGIEI